MVVLFYSLVEGMLLILLPDTLWSGSRLDPKQIHPDNFPTAKQIDEAVTLSFRLGYSPDDYPLDEMTRQEVEDLLEDMRRELVL